MKAEDYLKEHRIYNDETIYNSAGDIVGTLSQLMNDYHESEVKKLNIPAVIKSVCEYGMNPNDCIRKADTCFDCLNYS